MLAITRGVSPRLDQGERTHLGRAPIDLETAVAQHADYEASLAELGCQVKRLAGEPELPDSVFVEDTAVVLDELAVIARPGAASRRPETPSVAAALSEHHDLRRIEAPATLDGGDVLVVGQTLYVGQGSRTNAAGLDQLARIVEPHGYGVRGVGFRHCLHLKSAVTAVAERIVLLNPAWVDRTTFDGCSFIETHPDEPSAANALLVGGSVIYPIEFPRTTERLDRRGVRIVPVAMSELAKAEGGVTCCSLVIDDSVERLDRERR